MPTYVHVNIFTGLEDYGWTRGSGQLKVEWEVEVKARVDFVLVSANANQGVQPKDASARRICIPVGLALSA